jgi:hypothetical protein
VGGLRRRGRERVLHQQSETGFTLRLRVRELEAEPPGQVVQLSALVAFDPRLARLGREVESEAVVAVGGRELGRIQKGARAQGGGGAVAEQAGIGGAGEGGVAALGRAGSQEIEPPVFQRPTGRGRLCQEAGGEGGVSGRVGVEPGNHSRLDGLLRVPGRHLLQFLARDLQVSFPEGLGGRGVQVLRQIQRMPPALFRLCRDHEGR